MESSPHTLHFDTSAMKRGFFSYDRPSSGLFGKVIFFSVAATVFMGIGRTSEVKRLFRKVI